MAKPIRFRLQTEVIELQQLLKAVDIVSSGSEAKLFLQEHEVRINGEQDQRRSRKLRVGDAVLIDRDLRIILE